MNITKEFIKEVEALEKELIETNEEISKIFPFIKAQNRDKLYKVKREGKEVEIKEETLWTEVYHLGLKCQAGEILKPVYPEIFELSEKTEKLKIEIQKKEADAIGFDIKTMTLLKLIKLIIAIVKNIKKL